jgi:glycosyltransferase involved in cell wall biosynthesis
LTDVTIPDMAGGIGNVPDCWDVSVVITTYNRAGVLARALESLLRQEASDLRYEILVVDNNSTDSTWAVVESLGDGTGGKLRYLFEPRQGVAYGRNAGIRASRAPIIAFTDDDVTVAPDWIATLKQALDGHPQADCVGGRVLPRGDQTMPSWLGRDYWGPVALLDYGDSPFYVTARRRLCLITANAAFRREVFGRIGLFAPHMVAVNDNELLVRLWRAGGQGLYEPNLVVTAHIADGRLTKRYHRRWHQRHGYYSALMHDEGLEGSHYGRFLGVPAWIYREAVDGGARSLAWSLRGDLDRAFLHERRFRFALGFVRSRWQEVFRRTTAAAARRG